MHVIYQRKLYWLTIPRLASDEEFERFKKQYPSYSCIIKDDNGDVNRTTIKISELRLATGEEYFAGGEVENE